MAYTCYEMIRDCRDQKPEGWAYLVTHYVPVARQLAARYGAANEGDFVEKLLAELRQPGCELFASLQPAPERYFVAELRQLGVRLLRSPQAPAAPVDVDKLTAALEPLALLEKQAVWFQTMGYSASDASRILRMVPAAVERARDRAAELLRAHMDSWSRDVIAVSGNAWGYAVAERRTEACIASRLLFDIIDGRATWQQREAAERHVTECWHCIDNFCRLWEVTDLLRASRPLTPDEAEPYLGRMGLSRRRAGLRGLFARQH